MSDLTEDFEYTLTRRALRQIKAEAWDEGNAAFARSFLRPLGENGMRDMEPNPYRAALANAPAEDNHPTTDTQQGERA